MDLTKLLEKAKKRDPQAFGEIYDIFAQKLYRYIQFKIKDRQAAEDILQEVFIKAWQGLCRIEVKDLNFSGWIFRIASNTINDYFRKRYRSIQPGELDENFAGDSNPNPLLEKMQHSQDSQTVIKALAELPPQYREILHLRFVEELNIKEVSRVTGRSSLSVRVTQYRALKKLRQTLIKKYDFELQEI